MKIGICTQLVSMVAGCCGQSQMSDDSGGHDAATPDLDAMDSRVELDADIDSTTPDASEPDGSELDASALDAGQPDAFAADAAAPGPDVGVDSGASSCTAEGMFRRVDCECGGMRAEQCTSGFWREVAACDVVPQCTTGAFETRSNPDYCSVEQRTCSTLCLWSVWEYVIPPGDCSRGDYMCYPGRNCECTDACTCVRSPGCPY